MLSLISFPSLRRIFNDIYFFGYEEDFNDIIYWAIRAVDKSF